MPLDERSTLRAKALYARAVLAPGEENDPARVEEARTSAFLFVLLLKNSGGLAVLFAASPAPSASPPPRPAPPRERLWRLIRSNYKGACKVCQERYDVGEVVWYRQNHGCSHKACGKPEVAATSGIREEGP